MPKYRVTFTYSEEDSIDLYAANQEEAIRIFPDKLPGFDNVEFSAIERIDTIEHGELDNERDTRTIDMFN